MSVTIRLADEIDISRGDMICRPHNQPDVHAGPRRAGLLDGRDARRSRPGAKYAIKHTTRWARALVKEIDYRIDINTLHRDETATELALNEIGRVRLRTTQPLFVDPYQREPQDRRRSSSSTRRATRPSPRG